MSLWQGGSWAPAPAAVPQSPRHGSSRADTATLSSLVSLGQHPEHSQHPSHLQAEDGLALVPREVLLDALQANKYVITPAEKIQKLPL